jgi:two-component system sensor kinase FixL
LRSAKPIEAIQAELFEAGRMSELGAFAAALAHEINQPLAAIANYAEAARQLAAARTPEQTAAIEAVLAKLDQQAARVAQIVRSLRETIAQRQHIRGHAAYAALGAALGDALALARVGAPAFAAELALAPDLPAAAIDPVQLQLVVLHLVRNAQEAMAGAPRGALTIGARRAGNAIEIAVADSGPGVAPEAAATLFQPFKSTKGGLGIGLAICKAIVEAHDGRLWYEPGASGGATFRFTLPIAHAATNHADPAT